MNFSIWSTMLEGIAEFPEELHVDSPNLLNQEADLSKKKEEDKVRPQGMTS